MRITRILSKNKNKSRGGVLNPSFSKTETETTKTKMETKDKGKLKRYRKTYPCDKCKRIFTLENLMSVDNSVLCGRGDCQSL